MQRLFCVTTYVFNASGTHTLFLFHRKLNKWLVPGGKVDPSELPDDAAIRECFEETGVHITLLGERAPVGGGLVRPYGMQLNTVIPDVRQHIDFIYLALAQDGQIPVLNEVEAQQVLWVPVEDVLNNKYDTFDSVKTWVKLLSRQVKGLSHD